MATMRQDEATRTWSRTFGLKRDLLRPL
jgi:hypothetical protein